jgi:hypothetical protein
MNTFKRVLLGCLVPTFSVLYAAGAHYHCWDRLTGRDIASQGIERLSSPKNYPTTCVFADEREFRSLLKLILSNTNNSDAVKSYGSGKRPSAILRVGGSVQPPGFDGKNDPTLPNPDFVPDSEPVVFFYGYSRADFPKNLKDVGATQSSVGQLADLRRWIQESRELERFIAANVLIWILAFVVVLLNVTADAKGPKVRPTVQPRAEA